MIVSEECALSLRQEEPTHHNFKSKVGEVYGRLTVKFYAGRTGDRNIVRYVCQCSCGNFTVVTGSNLRPSKLRTTSCGCFRDEIKKTIDDVVIQRRIKVVEETTEYKVVSANQGAFDSIWDFLCEIHGKFSTTYGLVTHKRTKCPQCAVTGFKSNLPGYFYLNAVFNGDEFIAIKYGITNKSVNHRLRQIQSKSLYELDNIVNLYFENGIDALNLETSFAREFGRRFLSREELPSGFTETIDPSLLEQSLQWLKSHTNQ